VPQANETNWKSWKNYDDAGDHASVWRDKHVFICDFSQLLTERWNFQQIGESCAYRAEHIVLRASNFLLLLDTDRSRLCSSKKRLPGAYGTSCWWRTASWLRLHKLWKLATWAHDALQLLQQVCLRFWPPLHLREQLYRVQESQILLALHLILHILHDRHDLALDLLIVPTVERGSALTYWWPWNYKNQDHNQHLPSGRDFVPLPHSTLTSLFAVQEARQAEPHSGPKLRKRKYSTFSNRVYNFWGY